MRMALCLAGNPKHDQTHPNHFPCIPVFVAVPGQAVKQTRRKQSIQRGLKFSTIPIASQLVSHFEPPCFLEDFVRTLSKAQAQSLSSQTAYQNKTPISRTALGGTNKAASFYRFSIHLLAPTYIGFKGATNANQRQAGCNPFEFLPFTTPLTANGLKHSTPRSDLSLGCL